MLGSATLTTDTSRMTMNWARQERSSVAVRWGRLPSDGVASDGVASAIAWASPLRRARRPVLRSARPVAPSEPARARSCPPADPPRPALTIPATILLEVEYDGHRTDYHNVR